MKPAVLMMFRDEADILGKCLEHWYALGVRDFYLCDNGSNDDSLEIAQHFIYEMSIYQPSEIGVVIQDPATDWPGRRVINYLKNRALADGCDWIFPADADEFLVLPEGEDLSGWLRGLERRAKPDWKGWIEISYLNVLPDGAEAWQEPQRKCFGKLTPEMTISMGNHIIEGVAESATLVKSKTLAHYRHYPLRSYPQFKRKMENYMVAFSQNGFPDHHHAESFKIWQVEGEPYLQRLWTELTGLPCE